MKKFFIKFVILAILANTFSGCIEEPESFQNTAKGNFEALWNIIDTRYCYLDYKNIDWDSVYQVFEPRIDTVKSHFDYFDIMGEMLAVLKDGHVNLYSNFDRSRYWNWFIDYPTNFESTLIMSNRYLGNNYRIAGGLKYNKIAKGKIGYIYYGSFSNGFSLSNIHYILRYFKDCKGLIIDVRNNGGGSLTNSEKLASFFFKEKTLTSYISHKIGVGHSDFSRPIAIYTEPNKKIKWEKPVILLTNRMSYSATNDFVNRMQKAPFCTTIGDITGGGGGIPMSSELPNGWMVRFSASPIFNADMQHIEWGITPNIRVDLDSTDINRGYDTIIEKAIELFNKQKEL